MTCSKQVWMSVCSSSEVNSPLLRRKRVNLYLVGAVLLFETVAFPRKVLAREWGIYLLFLTKRLRGLSVYISFFQDVQQLIRWNDGMFRMCYFYHFSLLFCRWIFLWLNSKVHTVLHLDYILIIYVYWCATFIQMHIEQLLHNYLWELEGTQHLGWVWPLPCGVHILLYFRDLVVTFMISFLLFEICY